jgi:hypothetical protein
MTSKEIDDAAPNPNAQLQAGLGDVHFSWFAYDAAAN